MGECGDYLGAVEGRVERNLDHCQIHERGLEVREELTRIAPSLNSA